MLMPETPEPRLTPADITRVLVITLMLFFVFSLSATFLDEKIVLLIGELLLIVPAVLYVRARRFPFFETFRLKPVQIGVLASTILLFLPVYVLTDELDRLIQHYFPMPDEWAQSILELVRFSSWPQTISILAAGVFFAAFSEEMLFRGLVQRSLEMIREPAAAIVSASVLFALVHFNPWSSIQILLLGIVLGYVAWKSGSILPSMLLHGLNNLLSILMINAPEESLHWYAEEFVRPYWVAAGVFLLIPTWRLFSDACRRQDESS